MWRPTFYDMEALRYDPQFSWVIDPPRAYFNKDNFSRGEYFKVIAYHPGFRTQYGAIDIKVEIYPYKEGANTAEEYEHNELVYSAQMSMSGALSHLSFLEIDTGRYLEPGSYIALVVGTRRPIFNLGSSQLDSVVFDRHAFHVFTPEDYDTQWNLLFGGEGIGWDEPMYWDRLESGQLQELLLGLPTEKLLSMLPASTDDPDRFIDSTIIDNPIFLTHLIGPLTTAFIKSEMGNIPFQVRYTSTLRDHDLPSLDLTKLFWLLNVTSPIWAADGGFFFLAHDVETDVFDEAMQLTFRGHTSLGQTESSRTEPRLLSIVEEHLSGQLIWDRHYVSPNEFSIIIAERESALH